MEDIIPVLVIISSIVFGLCYLVLKNFTDNQIDRNGLLKTFLIVCAIIWVVLGLVVNSYDIYTFYSNNKKILFFQVIYFMICGFLYLILRKKIGGVDRKKKRALLGSFLIINSIGCAFLIFE